MDMWRCSKKTKPFRGIKDDFCNRSPDYLSDWTSSINTKVLSSTIFIFFTSITPAITFSLLLVDETNNEIGAVEVLVATSITGMLFALFAGQPLLIVGVTGPVAILTVNIYDISQQLGVKFIPLFAWSQMWGALFLMMLAALNACDYLKYVTRFSCEIFGFLIALLYLYTGIEGIALSLGNMKTEFAAGLLQFIIAIGTLYLAQVLAHAQLWNILTERTRDLVSDYGATISFVFWSFVPSMASYRLEEPNAIPTLYVPLTFETSSGRAWLADFTDIPAWGVFAAIFPGIIIAVLFFFDHNVSSLLAQETEMKLKKSSAFHLDLFVIGVGVVLTGILGIPPTNGLIPQAPLHVKSLMVKKRIYHEDGTPTDLFEVRKVHEQRLSNLMQSLLIGVVCFRPFSDILRSIPKAVLYGLFLYLGASSFEDNELAYRVNLLFMDRKLRFSLDHPYEFVKRMSHRTMRNYTLIQLVLVAAIFGITFTPAAVIFPVLIAALVCLRFYGLTRWFSSEELGLLDEAILAHPEELVPPEEEEDGDEAKGGEGEGDGERSTLRRDETVEEEGVDIGAIPANPGITDTL